MLHICLPPYSSVGTRMFINVVRKETEPTSAQPGQIVILFNNLILVLLVAGSLNLSLTDRLVKKILSNTEDI